MQAAAEPQAGLMELLVARGVANLSPISAVCAARREQVERERKERQLAERRATLIASRASLLGGKTRAALIPLSRSS